MNIGFQAAASSGNSQWKMPKQNSFPPSAPVYQPGTGDIFIKQDKPASTLKFKGFVPNDEQLLNQFTPPFRDVIDKAHNAAVEANSTELTANHLIWAVITTLHDVTSWETRKTRETEKFAKQLADALMPNTEMAPSEVATRFMPLAHSLHKPTARMIPSTHSIKIHPTLRKAIKNIRKDSEDPVKQLVGKILWVEPKKSAFPALAQYTQDLIENKKRRLVANSSDSDMEKMDIVEMPSDPYDILKMKSPMLAKWVEAASDQSSQGAYDDFAPLPALVSEGVKMALQELKTNRKNPVESSHNKNLESLNALIPPIQRKDSDKSHLARVLENALQKLQALPQPGSEAELTQASNHTKQLLEQFLAPSFRNDFSLGAFVQAIKDSKGIPETPKDYATVAQILSDIIAESQDKRLENMELFERTCPTLMKTSANLVRAATEGKLPPVLMRQEATDRMLAVINSGGNRTNIMLNAASGEGKTFAVFGLAQRLANNDVPKNLQGAQLIKLDMSSLNTNTFKELNTFLNQHGDRKVIVFLDEIHMLGGDGGQALVELMKSSGILERKNLTFIGATTPEDWRKCALRNDPAFQGRFHDVALPSFSKDEKLSILGLNALDLKNSTGIEIPTELLEQGLTQASAKWPENSLRRAIDVFGLATALAKGTPIEASVLQDRLQQKELWRHTLQAQKTLSGRFKRQLHQTETEANALATQLQRMNLDAKSAEMNDTLKDKHIRQAMAILTGERIGVLSQDELSKIRNAKEILSRSIVGQPEALGVISEGLRKMVVRQKTGGLKDRRPVLSMLLCGPTGVGKTEVPKLIAKEFMGGNMIRLDMSEYAERHDISRLTGTAPGYIGYENGGLVDQVRQNPNSVIVFDEIEKAHPDIFNALLQILEEGELRDNQGQPVSFRNAIIALTSNLNNEQLTQLIRTHRQSTQNAKDPQLASRELEKQGRELLTAKPSEGQPGFKPEHLGRLDYVIPFSPLYQSQVSDILDIRLREMNQAPTLQDNNLEVVLSPKARARLVELSAASGKSSYAGATKGEKKGEIPLQSGARDVRSVFERLVYDRVFEELTFELDGLEDAKLIVDYDSASQSFALQTEFLKQEIEEEHPFSMSL